MKKYLYTSHNGILDDHELNSYGKDGWELISHSAVVTAGTFGSSNELRQYYIFKKDFEDGA